MTPTQRGAAAMQAEMERYDVVGCDCDFGGGWAVVVAPDWHLTGIYGTRDECETWRYERAFAAGQEAAHANPT